MPPSVGYTIADVATLTAIGSGDRDDGYARLLLNDGNGKRFWVAYDDTATSGDYQPDDTPATGYWKKVEGAGREVLTADTTRYVDGTNGNDSNDGSSSGSEAWATLTAAATYAKQIDFNGFNLTVQVADGTYTAGFDISNAGIPGSVILLGNTSTPANCTISTTSENCITLINTPIKAFIRGFKLQTTTSGQLIDVQEGSKLEADDVMDYGPSASNQIRIQAFGRVVFSAAYTISGGANTHVICSNGEFRMQAAETVTLSGTPAFSDSFVEANRTGVIVYRNATFSGSATGNRYLSDGNSIIDTNGAGATYLPGNATGNDSNGGQYI